MPPTKPAKDLTFNPSGYTSVGVHRDTLAKLDAVRDDISQRLGIELTRSQALKYVVSYYLQKGQPS